MIIVHLFKSKWLHNDTEVLPPVITFVMQLIWFYPPKGHKSRSNHYNKSDLFNLELLLWTINIVTENVIHKWIFSVVNMHD